MAKIALPLSLAALAVLAACSSKEPAAPAPAPVVIAPGPVVTSPPSAPQTVVVPPSASTPVVVPAPSAVRPGFGRIESLTALPSSAAAGGTRPMYRVGIKMDDGTVQYIDTPKEGLSMGDRVELTTDGYLRHPA